MDDKLEKAQDEYTKDGSVDLRGNPILRSKRGGWTACSFLVVYEVFERMTFFGVSSNLVLYLTNRLHQGTVEAANNVTNWVGTVLLLPILGACIADAYLGRYWTFLAGSTIYFLGMCLLTLAVSISPLKPALCTAASCEPASTLQLGVFFGALYVLALGNGGAKPNISTIGADQFDAFDPGERAHKLSFFNWWMFSIFLGTLFAQTVLVYLQDNVGWAIGYGIPTAGIVVGTAVFLAGTPFYRHKPPRGSPLTSMARVIVASLRKWRVPVPEDGEELHELDLEVYKEEGRFRIDSTSSIRFLNKAAVKSGPATPWTLSPVTQVEETKQILRMVPILLTMFVPCAMIAQTHTLFVKQGATLDHDLGRFRVPPASLGAFMTLPMLATVAVYDRRLVGLARARTGNPRGITLLQRVGVGLFVQIITMAVASLTERGRLSVAKSHGLVLPVPVTIFVLLPQYLLMGVADGFFMAGCMEFFYDQAPETTKSLGSSYFLTAHGVGNFLSSVLLSAVSAVTKRNGGKGWVLNDLNVSHLDYYYGFLTALCVLNFVLFLFLSTKIYTYRAELSNSVDASLVEKDDEDSNLDDKRYSSAKVCSLIDGCSSDSHMRL